MAGIVIFIRYFVNESDFESVYSDRRGNCQPIYISITDVVVVSRFEDVYAPITVSFLKILLMIYKVV